MTTQTSANHVPSPGNELFPDYPPMRAPHLEFVYRLTAKMHPTASYDISRPHGLNVSKWIGHIESGKLCFRWETRSVAKPVTFQPTGTVRGPAIQGRLVENSGADWADRVHGERIFYRLDARYAIVTDDGHHIFVQARGMFQPGPSNAIGYDDPEKDIYTQDEVEYFTHITFTAPEGPYNWMNSIVALGVLMAHEGQVCIDCWRLTNFPGVEPVGVAASDSS